MAMPYATKYQLREAFGHPAARLADSGFWLRQRLAKTLTLRRRTGADGAMVET